MVEFSNHIKEIDKFNEKEMISSLGKGVFIKTNLMEKDLYVDVGSNVIVKKTPEETIKIIESQIKKMYEAKVQLTVQLDMYNNTLQKIIEQIETTRNKE